MRKTTTKSTVQEEIRQSWVISPIGSILFYHELPFHFPNTFPYPHSIQYLIYTLSKLALSASTGVYLLLLEMETRINSIIKQMNLDWIWFACWMMTTSSSESHSAPHPHLSADFCSIPERLRMFHKCNFKDLFLRLAQNFPDIKRAVVRCYIFFLVIDFDIFVFTLDIAML